MHNLKPCPFCGAIPTGEIRDTEEQRDWDVVISKQIKCSNKYCSANVLGDNEETVIDQWNTRSYDEEIEDLKMLDESQFNYIRELQQELKDAYKHTSVVESHMDKLLIQAYELEMENNKNG